MAQSENKDPLENGLTEGEMTDVTKEIHGLIASGEIKGEGREFVENACYWLRENFEVPTESSQRPNRLERTAQQILFPNSDEFQTSDGRNVLGTCTEWGKAMRALLVAKGIPAIWVETMDKKWIAGELPKGDYSGHVFLDVYLDSEWYILNPTAHPQDNDSLLSPESKGYRIRKGKSLIQDFEPIAKGLDSRAMWRTDTGGFISLRNKEEWYEFIHKRFPENRNKFSDKYHKFE